MPSPEYIKKKRTATSKEAEKLLEIYSNFFLAFGFRNDDPFMQMGSNRRGFDEVSVKHYKAGELLSQFPRVSVALRTESGRPAMQMTMTPSMAYALGTRLLNAVELLKDEPNAEQI